MRIVIDPQLSLDVTPIEEIQLDLRSQDAIMSFLYAIQQVFLDKTALDKLNDLLLKEYKPNKRKDRGRPGMDLWRVVVLAALKQAINCTYDRLTFLVNETKSLRRMLLLGDEDSTKFTRQALQNNISALSPELLRKVNQLVVDVGSKVAGRSTKEVRRCRCDSKVVKTNVSFPTDLGLLRDTVRSLLRVSQKWATVLDFPGWRQSRSNYDRICRAYRAACKRNKGAYNPQKVGKYLSKCRKIRNKVKRELLNPLQAEVDALNQRAQTDGLSREEMERRDAGFLAIHELSLYVDYLNLFSDQITRRILEGETISPKEKVYSIFKPFTRWIVKGKVGILCELGVPVAFVEDHDQFILGYGIEWEGTDKDIVVPLIDEVLSEYPEYRFTCSFDAGFYGVEEFPELEKRLEVVAMPKKGRPTKAERARRNEPSYKQARKGHAGVESCMNLLNHRGLDLVREESAESFERVIATSVLAANLHRLGTLVGKRERRRLKRLRRKRLRLAA